MNGNVFHFRFSEGAGQIQVIFFKIAQEIEKNVSCSNSFWKIARYS
jgi:hypothetical protein